MPFGFHKKLERIEKYPKRSWHQCLACITLNGSFIRTSDRQLLLMRAIVRSYGWLNKRNYSIELLNRPRFLHYLSKAPLLCQNGLLKQATLSTIKAIPHPRSWRCHQYSSLARDDDTIYALSTPSGTSAIAVIRISGPSCVEVLLRIYLSTSRADIARYTMPSVLDVSFQSLDMPLSALFTTPPLLRM